MGLFNLFKKKDSELLQHDKELIAENSNAISTIKVLIEDKEYLSQLDKIQEQLKYLAPSIDSYQLNYDKKIKNQIDDLKIELSKKNLDDEEKEEKINNALKTLKISISERKKKD